MSNQSKLWERICNILIAVIGGIVGFGALYLISRGLFLKVLHLGSFWFSIFWIYQILLNSILEEGVKFLSLKGWKILHPYGFFLGLGWGGMEIFTHYLAKDVGLNAVNTTAVLTLQILTAGILCYFIKKKRPILGLLITVAIHTGFNILIIWPNI